MNSTTNVRCYYWLENAVVKNLGDFSRQSSWTPWAIVA